MVASYSNFRKVYFNSKGQGQTWRNQNVGYVISVVLSKYLPNMSINRKLKQFQLNSII